MMWESWCRGGGRAGRRAVVRAGWRRGHEGHPGQPDRPLPRVRHLGGVTSAGGSYRPGGLWGDGVGSEDHRRVLLASLLTSPAWGERRRGTRVISATAQGCALRPHPLRGPAMARGRSSSTRRRRTTPR